MNIHIQCDKEYISVRSNISSSTVCVESQIISSNSVCADSNYFKIKITLPISAEAGGYHKGNPN